MAGKLIIFSAPSGSGKSTIINYLLKQDLHLRFSISAEYYRYLKVLQDKDTDSVSNLLINGGLAEPIRVFSNIDGGVGILGSCHVGMFETEIASSSHSNLEAARFEDGID